MIGGDLHALVIDWIYMPISASELSNEGQGHRWAAASSVMQTTLRSFLGRNSVRDDTVNRTVVVLPKGKSAVQHEELFRI